MDTRNREMFEGAGVIVRKPGDCKTENAAVVVATEHAEQVSRLFFALKDVFEGDLDYFNKFEFYGRLADAANCALASGDELDKACDAMMAEACAIASEMDAHLYFAYGSNMDVDQMSSRCPKALFAGKAILPGFEFELDSAGIATVMEKKGSKVHGALWLIAASDESALDGYEGVASECYRKTRLPIVDADGNTMPSLVYISNRATHDGTTYRTGYMDKIIKSAKRLGFDAAYIDMLETK
jgi:cation transport regulator ChaC